MKPKWNKNMNATKTEPRKFTLGQALAYAKGEAYDYRTWVAAEQVIIAAGLCPNCACDGERTRLGPWQEGNAHEYAGRECPECEEFAVCGEQKEYAWCEDGPSDADPGL